MSAPVVTLFEKYGSGARAVGPRVAEALGVEWMDQAVSSADIESAKYPGRGEQVTRAAAWLAFSAALPPARPSSTTPPFRWRRRRTRKWPKRTPAWSGKRPLDGVVILGRNGALILGNMSTALHVQLDGPAEVRIARAMREEGIDEAAARRRQRNEDRVRAEMSERFYHWNPMAIDRYHLVLNTGLLDLDTAVEVIVAAYRARAARAARATT